MLATNDGLPLPNVVADLGRVSTFVTTHLQRCRRWKAEIADSADGVPVQITNS
jgi:hypothetical protein